MVPVWVMNLNVLDLARAAGPLLWVLIALSLYVVYLAVARAQVLSRLGRNADALIERARAVTAESGPAAALAEVDRAGHPSPAASVLRAGLLRADRGVDAAGAAMQSALLAEDTRLYAGLSALGTAAQIAPLLGLLGTVIGMVRSFLVFSSTAVPTPAQLATGISEALVNTAGGLVVAIIAYVARNALKARADRIAVDAERVREDLPGWLLRPESRERLDSGRGYSQVQPQPQHTAASSSQAPVLAFGSQKGPESARAISSGPNNTGSFSTTTPKITASAPVGRVNTGGEDR